MHGTAMPPGLQLASRLAEPIFTPSTKAAVGHDVNIDFADAVDLVGRRRPTAARDICLELFRRAAARVDAAGFVLADTKFELGYIDGGSACATRCDARLVAVVARRRVVRGDAARVRQAAVPRLARGTALGPHAAAARRCRPTVATATSERYVAAYERITGRSLGDWYGATP